MEGNSEGRTRNTGGSSSMKPAYIVIQNMVGYMPENEPAIFTNRRRAVSYAYETAREMREYILEGKRNARIDGVDGDYYVGNTHISVSDRTEPEKMIALGYTWNTDEEEWQ